MRQTLQGIKVAYDEAIPIICDNTSAINISKNLVMHSRTKHISIKYHYLREKVVDKEVRLEHISTKEQVVDTFTKALAKDTFDFLQEKFGVTTPPSCQVYYGDAYIQGEIS